MPMSGHSLPAEIRGKVGQFESGFVRGTVAARRGRRKEMLVAPLVDDDGVENKTVKSPQA